MKCNLAQKVIRLLHTGMKKNWEEKTLSTNVPSDAVGNMCWMHKRDNNTELNNCHYFHWVAHQALCSQSPKTAAIAVAVSFTLSTLWHRSIPPSSVYGSFFRFSCTRAAKKNCLCFVRIDFCWMRAHNSHSFQYIKQSGVVLCFLSSKRAPCLCLLQ